MAIKKLSDTELKFMELIWNNPEGIESDVIYSNFRNEYAVSTIGTILRRILEKGCAASSRKGLHHIFSPLIAKEDYKRIIEERELSKISGKIENLIASFYGKKKLSQEQSERLRKMLHEMSDD